MRFNIHAIGINVLMASLLLLPFPGRTASFNYLYIEASEGNSSGGHTAIQFENDIYHFQHLDSGLIRLFRRDKDDFHFLYRYLQNRPIHESRIEVAEDTFQLLKDHYKWEFLIQERQFKLLDELHKDRVFLQYLLRRSTGKDTSDEDTTFEILQLKGVGLFYSKQGLHYHNTETDFSRQQSLHIKGVRQKVEQRYGPNYLPQQQKKIEAQIKALSPIKWPALSQGWPPTSIYSFSERYIDHLTALAAVKVLLNAQPLQSDAFFQIQESVFKVSAAERSELLGLRHHLEVSLVNSINSGRPDWGYAVLINLARYLAVDASLQSGYWVFIDDFAENSEWIGPDQYLGHRDSIQVLFKATRLALDHARKSAVTSRHLTESDYSQIEMTANRYFELLKTKRMIDFRYNGEKLLPSKSIGLQDQLMPDLNRDKLTTALTEAESFENGLLQKLKRHHSYDLILRNCVTELFRNINRALIKAYSHEKKLSNPEAIAVRESEKRLGGYVDIRYNFIPFVSYQSVQERYRVLGSRDLNSYRKLELAKLENRQNKVVTAFRESNIVSSTLYKYNSDDALFVFFTDDSVLLRPLYGLFNTSAGIGQSIYGVFSWPFDSGKNLKSGATGILMSLPELVFFNMRKGSYKYLSFAQMEKYKQVN